MNIKYVTDVRIPTPRAQGYAIMKMCSEFTRAGAEVELFVPERGNNQNKQDPFDFYGIEKNFYIKRIPSFDFLGKTPRSSKILYWLDVLSFVAVSKFLVNLKTEDILYTRDFIIPLFFSKRFFMVLELHSIPRSKFLFNLSLKKTKLFVVLNSSLKNILVDMGISDKKILISPSGVDLNHFGNFTDDFKIKGISENDFVYGYIGMLKTMGMEKGVASGLQALKELPSEYKFLVVGGEKPDVEYYRNLSNKLGVSDRAIFVGRVPYSDVSKYASKCNAFVAPFPENEHYSLFMSPLKIFEYMASKKPIIATDLPSLREVLTDGRNSLLVPPGDARALAYAIVKLKENPDIGNKMADKAYLDVSEKYTWKIRAEKIISFIKLNS
ncbi:MAG: glycosyltransferase family 4 protein [Candidatus Zambryskibacteria bacterium]